MEMNSYIFPFGSLTKQKLSMVGGKNASLGEITRNLSPLGVKVTDGYAVTVEAFDEFLRSNKLVELLLAAMKLLDRDQLFNLVDVSGQCRSLILSSSFSPGSSRGYFGGTREPGGRKIKKCIVCSAKQRYSRGFVNSKFCGPA